MATSTQTKTAITRIAALRNEMKLLKLDAYVITHIPSLRYLFGFSGSVAMAVVTKRKAYFVTNDLYAIQVSNELIKMEGLEIIINRDQWRGIASNGRAATWKTVGFDPTKHTVADFKKMKKALSPAKLVETSSVAEHVTRVKSSSEIKSISQAAHIASVAYEKLLAIIKPGMTEFEVSTFLASKTRELGSEKDAFDIIVVAGVRSAMPHGRASSTVIKKGDVVTVDFGCCVNGLFSDMTRTFCMGTPTKKIMEVFGVLYEAHITALNAVVSGVCAADLDKAARSVIERAGYGEFFRHSLGHGLGYEVHENPRVSSANKNETIPAGCVITIEPGIYIPGKFGMRIEDDVVVTDKGAQILTSAPCELVIV